MIEKYLEINVLLFADVVDRQDPSQPIGQSPHPELVVIDAYNSLLCIRLDRCVEGIAF